MVVRRISIFAGVKISNTCLRVVRTHLQVRRWDSKSLVSGGALPQGS